MTKSQANVLVATAFLLCCIFALAAFASMTGESLAGFIISVVLAIVFAGIGFFILKGEPLTDPDKESKPWFKKTCVRISKIAGVIVVFVIAVLLIQDYRAKQRREQEQKILAQQIEIEKKQNERKLFELRQIQEQNRNAELELREQEERAKKAAFALQANQEKELKALEQQKEQNRKKREIERQKKDEEDEIALAPILDRIKETSLSEGFKQNNKILYRNFRLNKPAGSQIEMINLSSAPIKAEVHLFGVGVQDAWCRIYSAVYPYSIATVINECPDKNAWKWLKQITKIEIHFVNADIAPQDNKGYSVDTHGHARGTSSQIKLRLT